VFWLGLLLIMVFAVMLGVLPAGGTGAIGDAGWWERLRYLILPVATLTLASVGGHTRYVRSAMIEVLRQDYIRMARAKGVGRNRVLFRHALRNALIPVVTVLALDLGFLFSGALVTETIFAYPGMGKMIFDAIMGNDFNLALVALLFATLLTLAGNLLADLAYAWLDPRISYR
jgi:peptide/nickel transport system permease protein